MKPTNRDINKLCAEACGWRRCTPKEPAYCHKDPIMEELAEVIGVKSPLVKTDGWANKAKGEWQCHFNDDFCEDRNALPELLQILVQGKDNTQYNDFFEALGLSPDEDTEGVYLELYVEGIFRLLLLPPRTVCIAALKALSRWPDSWETEEPE